MNISLGKSIKFPIPSISVPSSSSSNLFEGFIFQWKHDFFRKLNLNVSLIAKKVSYILFPIIIPICFFSSVKKFVNKINDWLIKSNSFLIDEFIFILYIYILHLFILYIILYIYILFTLYIYTLYLYWLVKKQLNTNHSFK